MPLGRRRLGGAAASSCWLAACLPAALLLPRVAADVYLNYPRGSNNKLTEQNNNADEQNRLFDSQNNAAGGYQVYDNCVPNCLNGATNNYDHTKEGSQEGHLYYYHGSELPIEWTSQHACGSPSKNTMCQVVIQYMCNSDVHPDKTVPGLRDGKDPNGNRRRVAGGNTETPQGANKDDTDQPERGRHETFEEYDACRKRSRNKGLYTADQNLNKNIGATATRQNNNGNRKGLECPEERDHYPYWHPSSWRDIVVFTTEAKDCSFYKSESQNVMKKHYCKVTLADGVTTLNEADQVPNTEKGCADKQGSWESTPPWNIDPPECLGLPETRDNHHGNAKTGKMVSYLWTIPDTIPDGDRCVLRLRYNVSSADFNKAGGEGESFDPFFQLDASFNNNPPLRNDPKADFLGMGIQVSGPLQVQVNTAQFGRTFQDRTHTFIVKKRPSDIDPLKRIINYGVRGRRGNIVQVYPAVEYDFVPQDLEANVGDYIHFQWGGSDANNAGNAGNGRQGSDRSNFVQIAGRGSNKPIELGKQSFFYDFANGDENSDDGKKAQDVIAKLAFLDQHTFAAKAGNVCPKDVTEAQTKNDNDDTNCQQLNAAPAYFDMGLLELKEQGTFFFSSTRNNDFSNRSQKAMIKIGPRMYNWWQVLLIVVGAVAGAAMLAGLGVMAWNALHALANPTDAVFSKKNRPLLLRTPCFRKVVRRREEERMKFTEDLKAYFTVHRAQSPTAASSVPGTKPKLAPPGAASPARNGNSLIKNKDDSMELRFEGLSLKDVDQEAFKAEIKKNLKKMGVSEEACKSLEIRLREGSVIAELIAPLKAMAEVRGKPITKELKVFGALPVITRGEKPSALADITSPSGLDGRIVVPKKRSCNIIGRARKCFRWATTGDASSDSEATVLVLFYLCQVFCGFMGGYLNWDNGINKWSPVAKIGGFILDFNLSMLLLPTMRSVQRWCQQVRPLDTLFNQDPIGFHIKVMRWIAFGTIIHVTGHIGHFVCVITSAEFEDPITPQQKMMGMEWYEYMFNPANRFAFFTGILIFLMMSAMAITASVRVRRHTFDFSKCPRTCQEFISWSMLGFAFFLLSPFLLMRKLFLCMFSCCWASRPTLQEPSASKKVGGFLIFWAVHKCWMPIFLLLLIHGPECWIWFLFPLIFLACDRTIMAERRSQQIVLKSVELAKGKVIKLQFGIPPGFTYQAGMYVQICCDQINPEEWHPFTLTSCPEETYLSVAIRAADELDWCSALRRKLVEDVVDQLSQGKAKAAPGTKITYEPYMDRHLSIAEAAPDSDKPTIVPGAQMLYARPQVAAVTDKDGNVKDTFKRPADGAMIAPPPKSPKNRGSAASKLKQPEGDLQPVEERHSLTGPMTETKTLTDFLQGKVPLDCIRLRVDGPHGAPSELVWKHKVVMLVGAGIGVTPFASILKSLQHQVRTRQAIKAEKKPDRGPTTNSNHSAARDLLDWEPCLSVHFYWLCRSQEEFAWFHDLLTEAVSGPAADRIEVNLFQTAEVEITKVAVLHKSFKQFMGRPNWRRIFPQVAEQHPGEDIGCFLCGPQALRGELRSGAASALSSNQSGTKFTIHAENF